MKRPSPDPDEEPKAPSTTPCADAPIWPPAEDAEVALFIIPGKPMPWASVIDTRSASRLQIAGFDPPLFEPKTTAPPLASHAPEAVTAASAFLPSADESVTAEATLLPAAEEAASELILNAEAAGLGAPAVLDLELSTDDDVDAFEPSLDALPSVVPDQGDEPRRWWAAVSSYAASASRLWSTGRCHVTSWRTAAFQKTAASTASARAWLAARPGQAARRLVAVSLMASRATAARAWWKASQGLEVSSRAMRTGRGALRTSQGTLRTRLRAAIAVVSRGLTAARSRVVAGWPRVLAGRERVIAQWARVVAMWARVVAMWPRLVALIVAWRATAIRAWANTRTHVARWPSAVPQADLRRQLRLAADATAVVLLAVAVARLAQTVIPIGEWTRVSRVDAALAATPLGMVAALAPAIEQRAAVLAPAIERRATDVVQAQAARSPQTRVASSRPPAALTPRRMDTAESTVALSPPVERDAARADLRAPADRASDIPVPAPFPTPREDSGPLRADAARADLRLPPVERASNIPVPAPFPTPRAERAAGGALAANEGIAEALRELQVAYERRDATLAKAVWPTVNERALARAFDGLRSQSVTFDGCKVKVSGATGEVECRGVTTYVTRVGSQDRRRESRQWKFRVQKGGDSWLIMSAAAR